MKILKQEIKERITMIQRGEVPEGYKKTKVGVIPKDWKVIHALKAFSLQGGFSFKSQDTTTEGVKWLKIANVGIGKIEWASTDYLPSDYIKKHENHSLKSGDIVMALTRPILGGKLKIAKLTDTDVPSLLNQRVGRIDAQDGFFNDYIYYYLSKRSVVRQLESLISGSDPPNLGKDEQKNLRICLPVMREQQQIAQILSTWDKAIELKSQLIEEKKEQKRGLMQKLLTGKVRLPGFDGEWGEVRLEDVLFFPPKKAVADYYDYQLLTVKLHLNGIEATDKRPNKTERGRPYYLREPGELLIGRQNFHNGGIGIVPEGMENYVASNAISSLKANVDNLVFLFYYLSQVDFYKKVGHMIGGTGQKEISERELKKLKLLIPRTLDEQQAIANILSTADDEIELLEKELELLKEQKKGLMQLLLTGIVRVKEVAV